MVLEERDPLFTFKVLRQGRLVYCRDPNRITDVIERVSRAYAELYPRHKMALQETVAEVVADGN
ncbi:MAG: hypothetical protein AB1700_06530 [Bacillota bacterium]